MGNTYLIVLYIYTFPLSIITDNLRWVLPLSRQGFAARTGVSTGNTNLPAEAICQAHF